MKIKPLALLMCALVSGAAIGQTSNEEAKREIERQNPSITVEQTFIPHVWVSTNKPGSPIVYFYDDGASMLNDKSCPSLGKWCSTSSKKSLPESEQKQRFVTAYEASLKALNPIKIGNPNAKSMILLSAVDCPSCRLLEKKLHKANASFWVLPRALSPENRKIVEKIYCSQNPSKNWADVMLDGEAKPVPSASECNYQRKDIVYLAHMLGGASPSAIFADGTTAVGPAQILKRLGM